MALSKKLYFSAVHKTSKQLWKAWDLRNISFVLEKKNTIEQRSFVG